LIIPDIHNPRLQDPFFQPASNKPVTPAADLTEEEWDRIIDINLRSVFLCMKQMPNFAAQ
jgi:NAD(P)-dependent dehydrogenase (short-subunit alcohol dehydrogenase family)